MADALSHIATRLVNAPAEVAFAYLSDPLALGRWSLGCFDSEPADAPGLYTGRSLIDGSQGWFRIDADAERFVVDYLVGPRERLVHRISARILAGAAFGQPEASCLVSLSAWRPADMDEARWRTLSALHEAEIVLLKGQIEAIAARTSD